MVAQGVFATGNLRSYCTVGEVLGVLSGYDLGPFGSAEALAERIKALLPISRSMVDKAAGRDFLWHDDEVVEVDGSGSKRLHLADAGVWSPVTVREVRIAGRLLGAEEWKAYPEMCMVRLTERARQQSFPNGVGNVSLLVNWGCEETPAEVKLAQAKLAAAELLAEIGGEGGAVQETRIGDYSVRYAEGGRFAAAVKGLCEAAAATLERYRMVRMGAV
jgi:hypothetical protein